MNDRIPRILRATASKAAFLLVLAVPGSLLAASGRDTYGNTWRDSADGATYDSAALFDGAFTSSNPTNNNPTVIGPIDMGFPDGFPYYGGVVRNVWISDNGWLSFAAPTPAGSYPTPSATVPNTAAPQGGVLMPFWSDLVMDDAGTGEAIYTGRVIALNAFKIQILGRDLSNASQPIWMEIILYSDGRIKFEYTSPGTVIGNATIGIENVAGTDGIQISAGGTPQPGVVLSDSYVIEFSPPKILPAECALILDRGCTTFNGSLPGTLPGNVLYYGCDTTRYEAREHVQSFRVNQTSGLQITLTSANPLRAYLLDACDESRCIRGPFTTANIPLGPGTYYIAVDAPLQANEGAFTLTVTCSALGQPAVACPGTDFGTTVGGTNFWGPYACAGTTDLLGPEAFTAVTIATATNLSATLTSGAAGLDVLIIPVQPGELTASDCVGWGDARAIAWNAQPGDYLIVVDGPGSSAGGPYAVAIDCNIALDCSAPAGTIDLVASRTQLVSGDTTGGGTSVDLYSCDPATTWDGPEDVYVINMAAPGMIGVFAYNLAPGLGFHITDTCNEGSCVGSGLQTGCTTELSAGTHYLIVDGMGGAAGAYELLVMFEEVFNRWSVCEVPQDPTLLEDVTSAYWHFSDNAFCISNPASYNYPNGCHWAMYVTVRCGTEMHIPFYDNESGHVRIFDVFRGEYVFLTAASGGGWFQSGTDILWEDPDCVGGSDPRWNETITDVSFDRPDGMCGVFRLEFPPGHSGFVWELYANCAGDRTPLFNIHDSLCTALADYRPVPNLYLATASAVATCPDIAVTYELKNDGCAPAYNFPVILRESGGDVYTDVVPVILPGETVTRSFNATFLNVPTSNVELVADFYNTLTECSESPGVACDVASGLDVQPLPGCIGVCQVQARAVATPSSTCSGQPVTIDASTSASSLCPGGILDYQLRGPMPTIIWRRNPIFTGLTPAATADYDVDVRCADPTLQATCVNSVRVRVNVDQVPDFSAPSVDGLDRSTCNLGIQLAWGTAVFHGPLLTGYYNIYRSTVSCADAVLQPAIVVGYSGTSYTDVSTIAGQTYYYVVEAEDSSGPSPCVPRGPRNAGAVTRVDVRLGTCTPITDNASARPDLLPLVGGTLRVGGSLGGGVLRYGETFVEMDWSSDRPISISGGEHFHILRSEQPDAGFVPASAEPPRNTTGTYLDLNADDTTGNLQRHVWHYLVYTVDDCENDNRSVPGA